MNFNNINQKIEQGDMLLRPVTETDRDFINALFNDNEIKRYYIVPKEAQQDYRKLVYYWLNDIKNGAGTCWIIVKKGIGVSSRNENQVGFIAFEFSGSIKNAKVSYAIMPEYRRKGIATTSVNLVVENLKKEGVEKIEADIDRDNLNSERLVEKLGFTANKKQALIDPEMMRDGEIRMRTLWKKELVVLKKEIANGRIPLDATLNQIIPIINSVVEEINSKGQHPILLVRYFYLRGRIKFLEGNYDEAQQSFGQCNMITMNEGLPDIHENFYWLAKIKEAKGEKGNARLYYKSALERFNDNPDYITKAEIEREMVK